MGHGTHEAYFERVLARVCSIASFRASPALFCPKLKGEELDPTRGLNLDAATQHCQVCGKKEEI